VANSPQARKRARQNDTRRVHNHGQRSSMRTTIKTFLKAVMAGDKAAAQEAYRASAAAVDKAASKGLQHRNKASRLKNRLNARLRSMA
jgi:small subunit ribosomal protein S20